MFDPNKVMRYKPYNDGSGRDQVLGSEFWVLASDYDQLLSLYNAERQARKDDAREHQRELRDAYAEGDYNARNDAGTY